MKMLWPETVDSRRSMSASFTALWRWTKKNCEEAQSRQWKGVSTGSMRSPQEHKMGPEAPTSKDAGGSKRRIRSNEEGASSVSVCMSAFFDQNQNERKKNCKTF